MQNIYIINYLLYNFFFEIFVNICKYFVNKFKVYGL